MTTIQDVARLAGVSKSTVSNVLNGVVPVAPGTRRRVEEAIAELRYHPNALARSLKARSSSTIGIVVNDPTNAFFAVLAMAIEQAARERGFAALVAITDCTPEVEDQAARALIERRVDGVVLGGVARGSELHLHLLDRDVPVVLVGFADLDDPRLGVVDTDDERAMDDVVEHLASFGHRRVAFLPHALPEHSGERRAHAFAAAARLHGVEQVEPDEATGLAAHNDVVAIEAIDRLERAGRRVPADVSVVGWDDVPLAAHSRLALTTVRSDVRELGRRAAGLALDAAAAGRHVAHRELHPATLVVRGSTGTAA